MKDDHMTRGDWQGELEAQLSEKFGQPVKGGITKEAAKQLFELTQRMKDTQSSLTLGCPEEDVDR